MYINTLTCQDLYIRLLSYRIRVTSLLLLLLSYRITGTLPVPYAVHTYIHIIEFMGLSSGLGLSGHLDPGFYGNSTVTHMAMCQSAEAQCYLLFLLQ